nr:reverse transcriptase domain-containing protein [Tanacetum cinerariifolium]
MRQRRWIELYSDYECEIRYHLGKANVVADALSWKERAKPRHVREMAVTIQFGVKRMILAAQSEAFKEENVPAERLHGLDHQQVLGTRLDMSTAYLPQTDGQTEFSYNNSYHSSIRCAPFEALYGRKCRSPVLWAEIKESKLNGPILVQETTDKVVLIKEKLKAARDRQKSYVDNRRKPLEFEKCLADANLHVPLDEIKIDKTFRYVEEPVEIIDREDHMKLGIPDCLLTVLLNLLVKFRDEISLRRGYCDNRDLSRLNSLLAVLDKPGLDVFISIIGLGSSVGTSSGVVSSTGGAGKGSTICVKTVYNTKVFLLKVLLLSK